MAKVQGSDGKWYEGTVKDGRIWTKGGNTGVAPYSAQKKTLLSYASDADKAYAAAHPEQYNVAGPAAGLPAVPGAPRVDINRFDAELPPVPRLMGRSGVGAAVPRSAGLVRGYEGGLTASLASSVSSRVLDRATLQRIQSAMAQVRAPASNKSVAGPPTVLSERELIDLKSRGLITPQQFQAQMEAVRQAEIGRNVAGTGRTVAALGSAAQSVGALSAALRDRSMSAETARVARATAQQHLQAVGQQIDAIERAHDAGLMNDAAYEKAIREQTTLRTESQRRLRFVEDLVRRARERPVGAAAAGAPSPPSVSRAMSMCSTRSSATSGASRARPDASL